MHILAFDTCLGGVSVAVVRVDPAGTRVLFESCERRRAGHAERLMPMIIAALAGAGVGFADIGRIAVTRGPGSFTGVRTGIAAARGLALAIGCPAVGVGCLAAIACGARAELGETSSGRPLAVALDARLGMVFFQQFPATGKAPGVPLLLAPQACAEALAGAPAIVVGSAATAVLQAAAAVGAEARLPEAEPRASVVAVLASGAVDEEPLKPLYLRAPDAKPQVDRSLPRAFS
jgi:tRNA threonylcarbamoyladenosine biosynthesis protein TsaB